MSISLTGSFDLETFINTYPSGSTDTINLWVSASYSGNQETWYLRGVTVPVSYTQEEGKYLGLILRQAQRIGLFLPNPVPPPDCALAGSITCS
jgi:hypothetical protein